MKEKEEIIVQEVLEDFKKRQQEKRKSEAVWQLNMNFLMGNQYSSIGFGGEIEEDDKQYFWQEREVFNHIAPLIEARLTKLQRVKPIMTVLPSSGDEKDVKTAKASKKIIAAAYNKINVSKLLTEATKWSEVCGTSFYKIFWNSNKGEVIANLEDGKVMRSGDVDIVVCTPFEIFPDNICAENIENVESIIHAKVLDIDEIKRLYGVVVEPKNVDIYSLDSFAGTVSGLLGTSYASGISKTTKKHSATVIEKYIRPNDEFPSGRLLTIAGNKLLIDQELPFINGKDGKRELPFVRQICIEKLGSFFGSSVIERLIPIQRAYNAIKNRKHEFLNRLSMGVLTVEDGSVDTENLEEEGLSPGKILVYRQGSSVPKYMSNTNVPIDFTYEENRLLQEFSEISGVSDIFKNLNSSTSSVSGVALQLLIEQDETKISTTAESVRNAIKEIAEQILRLYKQFANVPRFAKIVGDHGEVEAFYFKSSDISSDDITFETESEIGESLAQKRSMIFELINAGLLHDENGKLSNRMRVKALELMGFGIWENAKDVEELHANKASKENHELLSGKNIEICEIDNHEIHINEHIMFMLGGEFTKAKTPKLEKDILEHIRQHKKFKNFENEISEVKE